MEKDFKLEKTGKRMPYIMPEGFMKNLEENVTREIGNQEPHTAHMGLAGRYGHSVFRTLVATAAAATLFAVCTTTMQRHVTGGYADVERAFDNLSYEDQAFMLDTYSNDVFMSQADSPNY